MIRQLIIFILVILLIPHSTFSQITSYTVKKAAFSSDKYDEYCPVYYKNGLVFSSNQIQSPFINYSNSQDNGLFKICYIDTTGKITSQKVKLLSSSLTTNYNDGPVSFNSRGDTIYYSRNQKVEGSLKDNSLQRNPLGLYLAVLGDKKWEKIREFRFNNEWYSITTPCLSPDGKKLYFSSDKPDGYGGLDLYYCQWKKDFWDNPVNLGPVINTKGNDAFPFINQDGELFFSSDGHPGLGGKDIFFSKMAGTTWLKPVRLDPPINSEKDDFGIITDSLMNSGYFSSNRGNSVDIYQFKSDIPSLFYIDNQRESLYCFKFSDTSTFGIDTLKLKYEWDFGDGHKTAGANVNHCFSRAGKFDVRLILRDKTTNNLFFPKLILNLDIKEVEQPYISSPGFAVLNSLVEFDGSESNLPGYTVLSYYWDFGDGATSQGEKVKYAYPKKGDYNIILKVKVKSDFTGRISMKGISKKISIYSDIKERESYLSNLQAAKPEFPDAKTSENSMTVYSAEEESQKDIVFGLVLLSSRTKIDIRSSFFRNLPYSYKVKEILDPQDSTYNYVVDRQINLMSLYPPFRKMIAAGFKNSTIKIFKLTDPVEIELFDLMRTYSINTDYYFDNLNRLTPNAYLILDQMVRLMNKYPDINIEVGVNSDMSDLPDLTLRRAQTMVNYFINRGINNKRLVPKGYGSSQPVSSGRTENERKLNRRIVFSIIDQ